MVYVLIKNNAVSKYPYSLDLLKQDNPNTSFPSEINAGTSELFGCFKVTEVDQPIVDHTQNVTEGNPVLINGAWTQNWAVTSASIEEVTERTNAAWNNLRAKRTSLLSSCDWTQVLDAPVNQLQWAQYRQFLRDLPSNTTDPFNPVWPVKPA